MSNVREAVTVWGKFTSSIADWQSLVDGIEPKQSGCGPIYEMPNPIGGRTNEDFCIADMRAIKFAEPHYHPAGVTEIYFALSGVGKVFVAGQQVDVRKGSVVIMPPLTAHYTMPEDNLVFGVVNTPPFRPEDYISLHESDPRVHFDKAVFDMLTRGL